MLLLLSNRLAEWPSVWEIAANLVALCVFCEWLSICVCASFPFGFEVGLRDLNVLPSDH